MADIINFQGYCNARNKDSRNKRRTPVQASAKGGHIIYFEKRPASKAFV